jgi:hypothetical protein
MIIPTQAAWVDQLLVQCRILVALCGFCLVASFGCESNPRLEREAPDISTADGNNRGIPSAVVTTTVYTADDFIRPNRVVVVDSLLVVVTPWDRPALRVINPHSGALVTRVEGPLQGGFLRSVIFARDTVWLADAGRLEVRAIAVDDLIEPVHWDALPMFPIPRPFADLVALEPQGFWFTDLSGGGAYYIVDRNGNMVREVGDPDDGLPEVGIRPFAEVTSRSPDGAGYVAAGQWSSGIALHDLQGGVLQRFESPARFLPSFWAGDRRGVPTVVPDRDARVGYLTVVAKSQAVYGLFSGRNHYPQGIAAFRADEIHEFSYDGDLTIHRLDRAITSLASVGEREFYGVVRGDSNAVIRFTLPDTADVLEGR